MTSHRTPFPYRERHSSWEETDLMTQRRYFDDPYDHPTTGYCNDTYHSLYDENEGYLENERIEYIDYKDRNQHLREQDGEYRHFQRENRKLPPPPLLQDFIRNKERDLDFETSRESRNFDSIDEYIRQQRELERADVSREKESGPRSLLGLEPVLLNDDRSRDHGGGLRSRDYLVDERSRKYRVEERSREYRIEERSREYRVEERSRDRDYRSRRNDDDYHRSDYTDDYSYQHNERRSRMEEVDYLDNMDPRRHDYHSEHARNDPYYQRDSRNDHDKKSEVILYGYRDRHRRCTERELRKQMDEYDLHGRAYPSERERDRRGREFSHDDKNKHSYSSRLVKDERFTRSDMRSYDNEPQRRPEGGDPRFKGMPRRLSRDYYKSVSRHSQRQRGGTRSKSPGTSRKAHSHSSSPARKSPPFCGKAPTHEKNPKRKMSELNGTKRRKCDVRQTNVSPKSQEIPKAQLITRDQFLSRDIFNSTKYSSRESEDKRTRSSDIAFRDSTSSRNSCGERDLRDELSDSRAAALERKPLHFEHSASDYEERPSTAISTRIIDNDPSAIRSIVQIPTEKFQDLHESCTKNKEEIHSAKVKRIITPEDPVIKSRSKQVSATSQPVRTSEVLKRKVSICSGRAPSPLLGAVEKPKVELPADDLRLLIKSRRLKQQKETTPSLEENMAEKNETLLMSPPRTEQQCQVSSERQAVFTLPNLNNRGRTDGMVELSYSDSEASTNEECAPPAPTGHACREVVMRRQVILDYGKEKSHPRTLHLSLDKEKGRKKLGNEKESSGNSNVLLEVVSEGMANPPVRPNCPLFKEEDVSLSTVEVVNNSFESQDGSHAADGSQRLGELTKDVNSFEVEQDAADAASSSVDCNENCNYSQQTELNVSKQHILDNIWSLGKYQETKDLEDIQECERLKEESNGAWVSSSEYFENEQQFLQHGEAFYRELVKVESNVVKENSSEHYEEEQKSFSHYEQVCSQELQYDAEECDVVITENHPEYYDEEQPLSHYEQGCSQERRYDAEESDAVRENHPEHYDEEQPLSHYEQECFQGLRYDAEESDAVKENHPEHYDEEQPLSHYEQECFQGLRYDAEESDAVKENHPEHYDEEQPLSHYKQECFQGLRYDAEESDAVRENHPEHYDEEQPLSHYEQECFQGLRYDAEESDAVKESHPEHYDEEQPLSHYERECSQERRYDAEESDAVKENLPEHYDEEQPLSHYEQGCSQERRYDAEESDAVRENSHIEEQPLSCYDEYSHEKRHFQEESDTVRANTSEQHVLHYEQQSYLELGTYSEESDTVRENTSEPYEEQQHISQYEQQYYQELGQYTEESDAVRENTSEPYEEQQHISQYEQQYYQELGHYTEESDAVRENTSEQYEKDQPVSYYEQEYSQELEHYTEDSDVLRKSTSRHEEYQPLCQEQQSYWELGQEFCQENEYLPKNGNAKIQDNGSESCQEDQPIFRYEAAEFSHEVNNHFPEKSTNRKSLTESFSEHHKEEQQDNKQQFFQEYEQFAGTRDGVLESFSGLSEQEYQSSDDEEETTSESGEEESLSSDGESYKTTSEEDNFYKVNDFGKQHKNGGFERQYAYYGDAMSEAAFSEVKASRNSEYPPFTNNHQCKHESAKDVEDYEYYDDFEKNAPEMSNGYEVILALDSFNNDESDVDIKHSENFDFNKAVILGQDGVAGKGDVRGEQEVTEVDGFSYDRDVRNGHEIEQDVIGTPNTEKEGLADRSQFTDNISTKDFNQSDNTHASMRDNIETTIDCDQITCECDRKWRSGEDPSIGTEDINQSDVTTIEYNKATTINYDQITCESDRKRLFDENPITSTAADNIATNNFDNLYECYKRISPEDGLSIGTEVSSQTVVEQSVKEFSVNKKCQGSDEFEIQHFDLSIPLCNYGENEAQKLNGAQYDPVLPTNQYATVNEQNLHCHEDNNELQEENPSTNLLNKSNGSEYDPIMPKKEYATGNEQNSHCYEDNNELQEANHSAVLLNKSSGSEYDPALPTKDYCTVNEPKQYTDSKDDAQKINYSADILNRSSSSEYDPSLPTKDYGFLIARTQYDDEEMQLSNRSPEFLYKSSGSEYDPTLPTKDNVSSPVNHANDDIQELRHLELNKSSGSETDVSAKDHVVTNEQDYHSDDVIQDLPSPDLNQRSGSESDVVILAKDNDVTNEQDYHSDDVIQDLRSPDVNQRSGSESDVVILAKDHVATNEQDYHSDDVIQALRSPDLNQRSGSESDVVILAKDNDVTNEKNDHGNDVIRELRHFDLNKSSDFNKSSGSEYDPHIPTKDYYVTNSHHCRTDEVIQDLRHFDLNKSSGSEYDPHVPTKDYDVTNAHDYHADEVIQDLRHPDLNKSSGSEYDPHIPTKDYDVTNAHDYHADEVIQDLRHPDLNKSSGSEYDPHIPIKDYDVTNALYYHANDVIQNLRHPDINGNSGPKTDVKIPTKRCDNAEQDYHSQEDIRDLYHPGINKSRNLETDVRIPTNDCDVANEQDYDDGDVPLECVQPVLNKSNEIIVSEYEPHLQSNDCDKSDFNMVVGDAGSTGTIAGKKHYNCSPRLPEKDGMQIEHDSLDTQECIIVFTNNDKASDDAKPSYEMILQDEYQILGAATEIFLPSDIDANHICIYQCVDFQLRRVLCPTSIAGDKGTSQVYHNLQAGTLRQEDLATAHITRNPRNPRAAIGTTTAPLTRGEYAIEERRFFQNQINLICSPISDEDQVSSLEEISCPRLNVQQGSMQALTWQENTTQRTAPECESVERNVPVEEQNREAVIEITIVQNNVGMSADEFSTPTGFSSGKSKDSEKETTEESYGEIDTPRSDQGLFDRMAAKSSSLASSKKLPTREPESNRSSALVETTERNRRATVMEFKLESSDDPDLIYIDEVQYFEGEQPVGKSEDTGTGENSNRTISAEDNMSEDDACSKERFDSSNASSREMPWYSADTNLSENEWNTEEGNDNCKKKLPRRRQSEMMSKLRKEFRRCSQKDGQYIVTSSSETSYSFLSDSNDSVLQAQPYDPECASLTQVSLSDMSLELLCMSSASSGYPEYVAGHQDSLSGIISESQSTSLIVTKEFEDNDLESQKPYDPANCLMDVDTFSELSGMSLDTPSSSALEYDATEADTTLVGVADDDSEPYTPEVYSRSPENDSEPYTPGAYSPVLSLSGDESDPDLFSCKYMSDSSAYNPESHCPVDMSTSSVSGNEADNEVSTGVSSPEFSSNQNITLSLSLKKKPSAKKVCLESYVGYSSLDKESSTDDAGRTNPEAYRPESFVPLSKPTAARRSSNRNSARVHSRSKSDDKRVTTTTKNKEFSIEKGDRPHTLQKSVPSTSTKPAITRGKERKSREENATGCKRKPLKSFVAMPCTNKRAKEDEVRKKVVHASTKTKKKSSTTEQKSLKKESVKRLAVSETNEKETAQDKSTPPLKKSKLSPRSLTEKRSSPEKPRMDTAHPNKNTESARRNSREEKFKKPVHPARCNTGTKSSERNKEASRRKSERKGSAAKPRKIQEGDSATGSSFTVLNELKSIMKGIHRKSPNSSNRTKSPESSAGTNSITKVKESVDEHHLLDEGHELLELALEESINRSKSDKIPRASSINNDKGSPKPGCFEKTRSLNLAEKVYRMKRKLAEAEELSGNDKMNLTKSLKPSQPQETRVHITLSDDLDNSADERGSVSAVKAMDEEALDTLRANQTLNVRSMNDKSESIELAVKCIGGGKDIINNFVVTQSKKINNDLGMKSSMSAALKERASEDENVQADDDRGRFTVVDNNVVVSENVVSSAIEKQDDSKTEMHSATVFRTRPTCAQKTVNELMEVNIVNSGNNMRTNKQDAQACDKENRLSTYTNLDRGMSEENEKPLIADKVSSVFENLKDKDNLEYIIEDAVAEPLTNETRKTSDYLEVILVKSIIKENDRENEKNSCKKDGPGSTGEDACKSSQDINYTLVKDCVISSATLKSRGQEKSSHEVCRQDRPMSDGRLTEDMMGKIVITDSGAGEIRLIKVKGENDRLSKDQDRQPKKERQDNENNEFDQGKNDMSRDGQPNKEKQGDEKNEFEQQKNVWSTVKENIDSNFDSYSSDLLAMGTSDIKTKNGDKKTDDQSATRTLNDGGQGVTCCLPLQGKRKREENNNLVDKGCESIGEQISPYADNAAVNDPSNRGVAQSPATPCDIPGMQTSGNDSAATCGKASISKVHQRPNEAATPSGVLCTQMVQTAASDSTTFCEKANTPKVQTRANCPSTHSGVPCTQMTQTAANELDISLCTLKDQTGANVSDSKNSKSKEENEDPCEAVSSTSAAPSKGSPKKNQKDEQTCSDSKEQESKASDAVISGGQPMEEGKGTKSEISLEEYIESQLQHGLSLPDMPANSGPSSNISSKILPYLPSISFTNTTATPCASGNSSFSPIKLPLLAVSSSSVESQKKSLSPTIPSKAEGGACLQSEVSKESSLANENECQVPPKREERFPEQINSGMDIMKRVRTEYERKIIAILQKRVDVEKAYREECNSIVNAVKALAREKKNLERELGEVLQSSLREISQKYVSELQRFVRNETI